MNSPHAHLLKWHFKGPIGPRRHRSLAICQDTKWPARLQIPRAAWIEHRKLPKHLTFEIIWIYSPHLCVGFLLLVLHPRPLPPPPPPSARLGLHTCPHTPCPHTTCHHNTCHHTTCPHTTCPHTTCHHTTCHHTTCPHTTFPHTSCHHTTCPHTTCPHTTCHNLSTHNLSQLVHTQLVITTLVITPLVHTQLIHTPLVITPLVPTQLVHTQLVITPLVITPLVPTQLVHTPLVITPLVITPLVHTQLVHTPLVITQLVHTQLVHTQLVITQLVRTQLVTTCPHTTCHNLSTHNLSQLVHTQLVITPLHHINCHHTTCPHTTCHPYNLSSQPPSFHVAGVALGDIYRHFAWQAWHSRHWAGSGGALGPEWTVWRRGCFAWQAWHLVTSIVTLRGRRGTWWHLSSLCAAGVALTALGWLRWRAWAGVDGLTPRLFCVAGVALGDIYRHFAWQAWHLVTSIVTLRGRRGTHGTGLAPVARLGRSGRFDAAAVLRGRRGTWWHLSSLCVAGVALGDIYRHFARQAWHSRHWAGSGGALGPEWTVWRRGCFAWQAWHLVTSIVTLRGRRGTWWHLSSLCAAGVALTALGWRAWAGVDGLTPRLFCVAGVALGDIYRHFAWQAWHLVTSIVTLRGRDGTHGTGLAPVARLGRSGRFDAAAVLRGRRGTWWHLLSLCVTSIDCPSPHFLAGGIFDRGRTPHTHILAHTPTHLHKHNLSIHNLLTRTLPHTTYSTPILHHLFSLSCFPHAVFAFLLLLVGRS